MVSPAPHAGWRSAGPVGATGRVPGMQVSAAVFRHAMGHFATGVTVITSLDGDGRPVGTTASAVTPLSLDPPLVLACFDRGDHEIVVARVRHAETSADPAAPLVYFRGGYASLAS
jgi:flavin reductase (DIM6/NTAB) family NADH-FMN oxidoreductase RutF